MKRYLVMGTVSFVFAMEDDAIKAELNIDVPGVEFEPDAFDDALGMMPTELEMDVPFKMVISARNEDAAEERALEILENEEKWKSTLVINGDKIGGNVINISVFIDTIDEDE